MFNRMIINLFTIINLQGLWSLAPAFGRRKLKRKRLWLMLYSWPRELWGKADWREMVTHSVSLHSLFCVQIIDIFFNSAPRYSSTVLFDSYDVFLPRGSLNRSSGREMFSFLFFFLCYFIFLIFRSCCIPWPPLPIWRRTLQVLFKSLSVFAWKDSITINPTAHAQ